MLQRLYDWTMGLAGHRHALWVLAAVAFIESSVFPIPPDVLIIPMVLAARARAWRIAAGDTVPRRVNSTRSRADRAAGSTASRRAGAMETADGHFSRGIPLGARC